MHDLTRRQARRRLDASRALFLGAALAGIWACGSDENTNPGSFTLAVAPTALNVAEGGSGNATVNITRSGSFAGAVDLTSDGEPDGVVLTFDPSPIPAADVSSGVTVAVDATVAPGDYPITITGSSSGVSDQTATLTLTVTSASAGSFSLAASPSSGLAVAAGAAPKTSTITVTRTAPFAGAVALTATVPPNMTATFNPTTIAAGSSTSTLSISATAAAANGAFTVQVRGTSSGVADATTNVTGTVSGGTSASITLVAAPASLSIAQGAAATDTVKVTRNGGFTGAVSVAVTGLPTGVTATPNPLSIAAGANSGTISIAAASTAAAGASNLTLTGSGSGIANNVVTLPVTVTGGSAGAVTVTFCPENAPIWVGAQDGTGAWTHVTPTNSNTYSFNFTTGKGGVATVDTVDQGYDVSVLYATSAELSAQAPSAARNCGNNSVHGTVAHLSATEVATVSFGNDFAIVIGGLADTVFTLVHVSSGTQDLVATRIDPATFTVNSIIVRRGLTVMNGGTLSLLDFTAPEAFAPDAANVTIAGISGSERASVTNLFLSTHGAFASLFAAADTMGTLQYSGIPAAHMGANEVQLLEAFTGSSSSNNERFVGMYKNGVSATTLTLGPALNTPTVTDAATSPYDRPRVELVSQTQYNRAITADFSEGSGTSARSASIFATAAYFGSAPSTWDVTFPDLSGASGFNTTWGLQTAHASSYDVSAYGGKVPLVDVAANGDLFAQATHSAPASRPALASRGRTGLSTRAPAPAAQSGKGKGNR